MDPRLRDTLARSGAGFASDPERVADFGDPVGELRAALESCALVERSNLGRNLATGKDVLAFLHRMSTGDVAGLRPGDGRPTVVTTNKGRIVERLFVHHLGESGVVLVGGPGGATRVRAHLERFAFSEELGWSDEADGWSHLAVIGPRARDALGAAGIEPPADYATASGGIDGVRVHALGHDGLSPRGVSVLVPGAGVERVWRTVLDAVRSHGGRAAGETALSAWRVLRGLPESGFELTEEHNPLEAGLWDAVSFDKGCYVGQEVVARLRTYDKVSTDLRGFTFPTGTPAPATRTAVLAGSRAVGEITSSLVPPGFESSVALGYVKRQHSSAGTVLDVGEHRATVVEPPFDL